ncbi:MAG: 2-amino-4-hydroxy-6-hydroxymethyldihydropteridine diphosphokinase [Rhabdochlamydiaceae bacterium]
MSLKETEQVYLSLGSNLGDSISCLRKAIDLISHIPNVWDVQPSRFFQTSPVSSIPQNDFINIAISLKTSLSPKELFSYTNAIEKKLGKIPKSKEEPRHIDIDIILFGSYYSEDKELTLPHPHWTKRLFVLIPLLDLVSKIEVPLSKTESKNVFLQDYVEGLQKQTNDFVSEFIPSPRSNEGIDIKD